MQGLSVLYANRMCVLEKLGRFFLKVFGVSTWLDFVLCTFFPVCLSAIQHRFLIHLKHNSLSSNKLCNKFETFLIKFCFQAIPQYIAYSWKSETKNRPWMIIIPFKIYLKSFPIQNLFHFFKFSLSLSMNVEKVSLMSLTWKYVDQTRPTIIHVTSRGTFGAVSTRILQEIYS